MKSPGTLLTLTLLAAMALLSRPVGAETPAWRWPVEGLGAGEGILFAPQSYIDGELNFATLYIGAPEGTPVVAPADGVVESFGLCYNTSLTYQVGSGLSAGEHIAQCREELAKGLGGGEDPRYIHISIGIRLPDGRVMWIGGLQGERIFRTGERVVCGERIGAVGYSYKKIAEPSVSLSVSDRRTRNDDPMTPFGIPTTFIPPQEIPQVTELTREQAAEDFTVLMRVLREAYPGIHDDATPEEVDAFCRRTLSELPAKMPLGDFYKVLRRVVSRFHDSHLSLYPMPDDARRQSVDLPQIYLGWIDSALVAVRCTKDYAAYYGRRIRSVDGIPADSVRRITERYVDGYDARVQSVKEYMQALWASRYYLYAPGASRRFDTTLEFDDGQQLRFKGWTFTGRDLRGLAPDWHDFLNTNRYPDADFSLKMLDDSTAYMGLSTFQLNAVEVDSLASFIRSAAARPNMIVDLRNNPGGNTEVLRQVLSFFAVEPFVPLDGYQWMARRDSIAAFEGCCMNYTPTQEVYNAPFERRDGCDGWFLPDDTEAILPDSATCYRGRLYVLINEGSCSAATIFPATVLRNHRGLIVGRETATAYHFMNAMKFADIRLPHSWLTVRVPLVRCVFDTTGNPRIPYGRGVIPDREIRLSLDEIAAVRGDSILNYTLALIDRGEYLGEDPFAAAERPVSRWRRYAVAGLVALVLLGATAAGAVYARRRAQR